MAAYSFGQLEDLWVQAGGPRSVAPVMAAIGLAESGGRNVKQKGQPLSRTGWGIWQITPGDPSLLDPHRNARAAVAKYRSQGLRAWTTYTTGRYKAYLVSANSGQSAGFGILTPGNFAGVDQGVDYRGAGPVPALDAVTITAVRRVSILEGGSYPLVGFRYDSGPYKGRYGYLMENFTPSVRVGQRLKAGQPIGVAKGQFPYIEYGFASGPDGSPLAPLNPDPHSPKPAGQAMLAYIQSRSGQQVQPSSGGGGFVSTLGGIASDVNNPAALGLDAIGSVAGHVPGLGGVSSAASGVENLAGNLTSSAFWLRALEIVGGMVLVLLGLYLLARQVGLAPSPGQVAEVAPVGRAAKLSDTAAAEMQFSPGRAAHRSSRRRRLTRDESDSAQRSRAIRERSARAEPSNEIPF